MALTNCSINTASLTKTGGAAIGSQNAQLIITPDEGYVVSASNFTNNTGSITGISNITLSDSTSAGAVGNTVIVSVDLDDNYVMPSANTTLTIDIDGAASLIQYTVAGTFTSTVSNATPSSQSNVAYNATGSANSTATISQLSKTFTASSGHHFEVEPSAVLNATNPDRYTITKARTYTDGRLTAVAFTITYKFSSESESGDSISFVANAKPFIVPTVEITNYNISKLPISGTGEERILSLFGTIGAVAQVTITRGNGHTYDFTSDTFTSASTFKNMTVGNLGDGDIRVFENIVFPESSTTDVYTFVINTNEPSGNSTVINDDLDNDSDTTRNTTSNINNTVSFSIKQGVEKTIQIGATHSDNNIEISENISIELAEGSNTPNNQENILDHIFTINSLTGPLRIISQPAVSNFTNTNSSSNGGTTINITSVSLRLNKVGDGAVLEIVGNIGLVGSQDVTSLLDLDNFITINNKTTVTDITVPCPKLGKARLLLKSQDSDGDTMTHSLITTTPAGGTLSGITGVTTVAGPPSVKISEVEYTNTNPLIEQEEIFFKANDGAEDSATGTITVLLENSAPVANDQTVSCKSGESVEISLDSKDPDHKQEELTYTFFPIEYAADGTTTIIQPPTDGLIYFNRSGNVINAPGKAVYRNNGRETQQQEIIKYRVTDPEGASDTAQLTINLTSDPIAISQLDNRSHEVDQGAGSTSPIVLEGRSPTGHTPLAFLLTTAPTGGTLHYQSNFSDTAITASSTNVLTSNNLYFNHTASNSNNTQFEFKAKDSLNNIGTRGIVNIIVNAVTTDRFYGLAPGSTDDTQSGASENPHQSPGLSCSAGASHLFNRTYLSLVTVGSSSTIAVKVRATNPRNLYDLDVRLYSNSARTTEVTSASGSIQRIDYSGGATLTSTYTNHGWNNISNIPAGTYFIKYIVGVQSANTSSSVSVEFTST